VSETKQPDWDKITEGKIRHGFAVAAFTKGMEMTGELCTQIECWVRYVVDGKSASGSKAVSNGSPDASSKETDEDYISEIIRDRALALTNEDRDKVIKSLEGGHITRDNLDICLRRIEELASSNVEL